MTMLTQPVDYLIQEFKYTNKYFLHCTDINN